MLFTKRLCINKAALHKTNPFVYKLLFKLLNIFRIIEKDIIKPTIPLVAKTNNRLESDPEQE